MPWKFRDRPEIKQWHEGRVARVAIVLALLLVLGGIPYGWIRLQHWIEVRRLVRADDAYKRGDFREALVNARGVLKRNPNNEIAKQIVAGATEELHSPEAMSWQRTRSAMETGDPDQLLGLADAFVSVEDFASADRALKRLKPADQNSARFHRLAAKVATKAGDTAAAESHWKKAIELAPEDDDSVLELAALQLASPVPQTQALGLSAIDRIKVKPDGRLPALRLLLEDAKRHGDKARAREVATLIASDREAEFSDKLALLSALRDLGRKRDAEFSAYLAQLETRAAGQPRDIFNLMGWMIDQNLALLVPEWAAKLPPEVVSAPPVAPGVAQALVRAADWKRLKEKVEAESWGEMEYLRLAFLTLALDRADDAKAADAAWAQALEMSADAPNQLERLGKAGLVWGLIPRAEEALWKLGASDWCPRWVMDYLWSASLARNDTAKLYEASKLLLKAQPEDLTARNNNIALALFAGQSAEARQQAEALYKENPGNALTASTYGFALLLQGKAKEAAAVMEVSKPEDLREPSIALYYGSFLAAAGETERASTYLHLAEGAQPLPDEKRLLETFTALNRVRSLDQTGDPASVQAAWKETLDHASTQPDLLELIAKIAFDWNWHDRAEEALFKLAERDRCPAWGREALWTGVLKTGNTAKILRVSRLLARLNPESVPARNNFALLGLLSGGDKDSPRLLAATLYKEAPDDPDVVTTYGLSLTQQGKPDEAVKLISALSADQLSQPRTALYRGIFLAAAGRIDEARPLLQAGAPSIRFPDEKALVEVLRLAFDAISGHRGGASDAADPAWNRSLAAAEGHPDWLEMLARIALKSGASQEADAALWKLAAGEHPPKWALESLWASAQKTGTSAQQYKVSKLLVKADPKDISARNNSIILALLTNQEVDAPNRQAEALYKQNVGEPGIAATYGLSLYLQDRGDEALKLMDALPQKQLEEPRTALYYGVFLAAAGQTKKAADYLRIGMSAATVPEERALVEKVATDPTLKAILAQRVGH